MSSSVYWENTNRNEPPVVVPTPEINPDVELAMNKMFLSEIETEDAPPLGHKILVPPLNYHMLQAIALHKHANHIREMIRKVPEKKREGIKFEAPKMESSVTPCPNTNLNLSSMQCEIEELPELSSRITEEILRKSVATLFAQIGFETMEESALNCLADVLSEFFQKFCHQIKIAMEDEQRNFVGFPNPIERVLTEMGLGGTKALNEYYKTRVLKYIEVLKKRCNKLEENYHDLLKPRTPSPVDNVKPTVRVQVEDDDVVEVENPEGHFSAIAGDMNYSILETGYQLLNSLEAETSMQMSDGPPETGINLIPEDDSHLSPYTKKKRFQ